MSHDRNRSWASSAQRRALVHMGVDAVPHDLRHAVAQLWINAEKDKGKGSLRLRHLLVVGPNPDFEVVGEVQVVTRYSMSVEQLADVAKLNKPHPPAFTSENFPKSPLANLGTFSRKGYVLRPIRGFTGVMKTSEDLAKIGLKGANPQELLSYVESPLVRAAGYRAELAAPGQHWQDGGKRVMVTVDTRSMQVCTVPDNYDQPVLILAFHERDINEPDLD